MSKIPVIEDISIYIQGYEFGPAVSKILVKLSQAVERVLAEGVMIQTLGVKREVKAIFLADELGEKCSTSSSSYIGIDLVVSYSIEDNRQSASPFAFNFQNFHNEWVESYPVHVAGLQVKNMNGQFVLEKEEECIGKHLSSDLSSFTVRSTYTATYHNDFTGYPEKITLHYAAFEPKHLKGNGQYPLLVWLHGQGEGGTDTDIVLLGNEVVALARDEIQSYFISGKQTGAYVLVVQTPTYWMDEGDGTNGQGAGVSRYTEALMDTIKAYIANNDAIDTDRVYLAGCSNGGYMTLNLALHYPDYFAALVPQAAAYSYFQYERNMDGSYKMEKNKQSLTGFAPVRTQEVWFDQDKVDRIRHVPIWFIHSADDWIVRPDHYSLPVYKALVDSGATNKWFSYYETVEGLDMPDISYMGHWSWIYFFNNQVSGVQDVIAIRQSKDLSGFVPSNVTKGGFDTATFQGSLYTNVFQWLNSQNKQHKMEE